MHISLQQMSVRYGHRTILDSISLTLERPCITAVMGPNGCGKTTLLRCIGGLMQPTEGIVALDGLNACDYSARSLAQTIAYVGQHPQADMEFTSFDTVLMGRNPYQRHLQNESQHDYDIVEQSMQLTGTTHLRHSRLSTLSGGELQRVMIARAIAQQTPVLLLDEPVSNLDIAHQIDIMRQLRAMAGKTILIVIHDLNLALRYCDDLLLLHHGHIEYYGPMHEGLTPERVRRVYGVDAHMADGQIAFDY